MRRIFVRAGYFLAATAMLVSLAYWFARPAEPGGFYAWARVSPPRPGELLRSERFTRGRDHMGVVAGDSPLNADLVRWTKDRLAAKPFVNGCSAPRHSA